MAYIGIYYHKIALFVKNFVLKKGTYNYFSYNYVGESYAGDYSPRGVIMLEVN